MRKFRKFVEDKIIPRLEVIEGVSKVDVGGVEDETVSIRLFPDELMKRGLTLDDVKTTISSESFFYSYRGLIYFKRSISSTC